MKRWCEVRHAREKRRCLVRARIMETLWARVVWLLMKVVHSVGALKPLKGRDGETRPQSAHSFAGHNGEIIICDWCLKKWPKVNQESILRFLFDMSRSHPVNTWCLLTRWWQKKLGNYQINLLNIMQLCVGQCREVPGTLPPFVKRRAARGKRSKQWRQVRLRDPHPAQRSEDWNPWRVLQIEAKAQEGVLAGLAPSASDRLSCRF